MLRFSPLVYVRSYVLSSFPDNSSYSFHWIALKLGGQLDHEMVQRLLFRGYSTPHFDSYYAFKMGFCI